jgi:hypothetical protein
MLKVVLAKNGNKESETKFRNNLWEQVISVPYVVVSDFFEDSHVIAYFIIR